MNTPDTEWLEAFDRKWLETGCNSYGVATKGVVKDMLARLIFSRDTYWKERVREEIEKLIDSNDDGMFAGREALDTLLENLK